ncbi:helix-turn-helix domain-containing protein [Streptomyces monticola]|uniref:Helix-turn-helix domain-containing protein n=1 Tax=Streptomyces monticola TaxID=2666263 RepID=A0ABW2JWQ4_9ACTN
MTEHPGERSVRDLDPRSLRGLAHPLRMRLLAELRLRGPATASQLGGRLGESSGSTSYHLRQLAVHGFVEDDPERGKGRERWWRAVHMGTRTTDELIHHQDPEVRGAMSTLLHEMASGHALELSTFIGSFYDWPDEWRDASSLSDYSLRLTPELARELNKKLHQLVESYPSLEDETPEGAVGYRVHLHGFPRPAD